MYSDSDSPNPALPSTSLDREAGDVTTDEQRRRKEALASLRTVQAAFAGIPENELGQELEQALAEAKRIQLVQRQSANDVDAE